MLLGGADLSATAARGAESSEIISNTPSSSAPNPPQHRRQKTTKRASGPKLDRAATVPSALAASDLIGTWNVNFECGWGSGSETITIARNGSGAVSFSGGSWNNPISGGEYQDGVIKIYAGNLLNSVVYTGQLTSPTTMSGTYAQSLNSSACSFSGTK
jgi:hypothetical protein